MNDDLKEVLFESTRRFQSDPSLTSFRKSVSFHDFLEDYTLHDSSLRLVLTDEGYYFTLGIVWDGFWNQEKLGFSDNVSDMWPYLFISFPTIYSITWTMFQGDTTDTILETSSHKADMSHLEENLWKSIIQYRKENDIELYNTQFTCLEGSLTIMHEGPVEIFCVNAMGEFIKI